MTHTSPGFVSVARAVIDELQNLVGCEQVTTTEAEVGTLSKDSDWYSPVLKQRLERRRAAAAVKVAPVDELRAGLAAAYRNDLPVTVRGGATGNYGQCIPLCGGLVVDITGLDRIVILVRVQVETNYPRPSRETAESVGVGREAWQSLLELARDAGETVENAVGELFLADFIPDMFLRVQFRRVCREAKQADVLGHN